MRFQLFVFLLFISFSSIFSQATGNSRLKEESIGNHSVKKMGNANLYAQKPLNPNYNSQSSIANAQLGATNPITLEVKCHSTRQK